MYRSSHQRCSAKKDVLRNFKKFTGKHLCKSLFFNKAAGLRCFSVNFAKFLRTPFFTEYLRWLLLGVKGAAKQIGLHIRTTKQML